MRVVHLSTIHQPLDIRIFVKECRTLAAYGYDVHLIVQNPPAARCDRVTFWPIAINLSDRKYQQLWQRYRSVWQQAMGLKGDVYHFHDTELILLGLCLKLRGAKVIYDVHEDSPSHAIALNKHRPWFGRMKFVAWWLLEQLAKLFIDGFVCVTPTIAAKFPRRRTWLVRNYPLLEDIEQSAQLPQPYGQRSHLALYAGGITEIRGIREMVDAMAALSVSLCTKQQQEQEPQQQGQGQQQQEQEKQQRLAELEHPARLILLGTFVQSELESKMRSRPGWQQVDFLGWQSRQTVLEQLGRSRVGLVMLHPVDVYQASIPIKLLEYMAAGLPIVASDFSLWRTWLDDVNCGLFVDPLDVDAIASALHYLFTHPEEAEAMGKRGQAAVRQTYHWEAEAQTLLTLYRTLEASTTTVANKTSAPRPVDGEPL